MKKTFKILLIMLFIMIFKMIFSDNVHAIDVLFWVNGEAMNSRYN